MKTTLRLSIIFGSIALASSLYNHNQASKTSTLYVGPVTHPCDTAVENRCLKIKFEPDAPYQLTGPIKGFDHKTGYESILTVKPVAVPTTSTIPGASAYKLDTLVNQIPVPFIAITSPQDNNRVSSPFQIIGTNRSFSNVDIGITLTGPDNTLLSPELSLSIPGSNNESAWSATLEFSVAKDTKAHLTATLSSPDINKDLFYSLPITLIANTSTITLEGTPWQLTTMYPGGQVVDVTSVITTATFNAGRVIGNAGCNNYYAAYNLGSNNAISMSQSGLSLAGCNSLIMEQESTFIRLLPESRSFSLVENTLTLFDSKNSPLLRFNTGSN
jgi:heat shock protein HslJ